MRRLTTTLICLLGLAAPAAAATNTTTIQIDTPAANATVAEPFSIAGWAIDTTGATGTGVDIVHVWAYPNPGSGQDPVFLGAATYGGARSDVGAVYGSRFTNSGYGLVVAGWAPGPYLIQVWAHSSVTGAWEYVTRTVTFTNSPGMWVDTPVHNSSVSQPFTIAGWALDRAAATGTGVDQIHVYAYKNPGSGTPAEFWGAATYGLVRNDVGGFYGPQFTNSGFLMTVSGKPAAV